VTVRRPSGSRLGSSRQRRWIALAPLALLAVGGPAAAQATDPVAAETLFDEGRRLMQAGSYAEACSKFEASQRLDPGVGTLLNLADCLERSGRTASAWSRFRETAAAAVAANQREREMVARRRVEALAPRLCRLRVSPGDPNQVVQRDGVALDRALWGEAVPVDPGRHEIVATAPGKRPWSSSVTVDGATCAGTELSVDVPTLDEDGSVSPGSGPPTRQSRWGLQRELALGAGGAAVVAAGVATFLALDARSIYRSAQATCTPRGCADLGSSAGPLADGATALFVTAGALAATGATLWLLAPSHAVSLAPEVAPVSRGAQGGLVVGLAVGGAWR
jgi:hypothetical protein